MTRPLPAEAQGVDVEVLDALVQQVIAIDADAKRTLIDTYLADAKVRVAALTAAAAVDDGDGVARAAHGLRSASAVLGALPLAEALLQSELVARSGQADLDAISAIVEGEYRRVAARLCELRGEG